MERTGAVVMQQSGARRSRRHIPQTNRRILRSAGQRSAVGTEGHCMNPVCMALQLMHQSPLCRIPEPYGLVIGATRQQTAIGREGHILDGHFMAIEDAPAAIEPSRE